MAQINKSSVALRICGDSLSPQKISELLGCDATYMHLKGDTRIGKVTGTKLVHKSSIWSLRPPQQTSEQLDNQIHELLAMLSTDLQVWKDISSQYSVDVYCGLFLAMTNEGLEIKPKTLLDLGERGIQLSLDIYYDIEGLST